MREYRVTVPTGQSDENQAVAEAVWTLGAVQFEEFPVPVSVAPQDGDSELLAVTLEFRTDSPQQVIEDSGIPSDNIEQATPA